MGQNYEVIYRVIIWRTRVEAPVQFKGIHEICVFRMTKFFESSQETLVEFFSTNEMPLRNIDKKLHIFSLSLSLSLTYTRALREKNEKRHKYSYCDIAHYVFFYLKCLKWYVALSTSTQLQGE
jgi:hypothetical protein